MHILQMYSSMRSGRQSLSTPKMRIMSL
jgi:hypothetical protein